MRDLLDRDRFAALLGARLVEGEEGRVVVEVALAPWHRDASGRVSAGVLFALADCAMSLLSNSERTAVAVATHLVTAGEGEGEVLRAELAERLDGGGRATTWEARITRGEAVVASFTGTTLALNPQRP
jgi:acyl-coenzyme A thioesterase PaaI-like protein